MISNIKQRALHSTKIIEGQIRGLQKMIDNEAYCMDILTQSLAAQKSLASLNKLILENHFHTHFIDMIHSGDEQQHKKALNEMLKLYELHNIKGQSSDDTAAECVNTLPEPLSSTA